jgi:NADPH2:quinone reductase
MARGVYLTFFGSFVFGTPGFPLSDVPLQQIAADAAAGRLDVKPTRIFRFEEIREAHRVMEAGKARQDGRRSRLIARAGSRIGPRYFINDPLS